MTISLIRCEATDSSLPDMYITVESDMVQDWPTIRQELIDLEGGVFEGYSARPSGWASEGYTPGRFIETWLVTAA